RADPTKARFNLAVVNWFNEEGSRFKPSMMGSNVFTGKAELEAALATEDAAGITVAEALDALGERGDFTPPDIASYAEIHVQQGRSMEEDGVSIGLVNATWAAHKYEFKVTGAQAHSGSTLMADRQDALLGAARLVVAARDLADEFEPGALHTACGQLTVYPNSPVVVASEVSLLLDLRSPSAEVIADAHDSLMATVARVCQDARVEIEIVAEHSWDRNPYSAEGVELARTVADDLGLTSARVMTVAGHDSTNMKDTVPTVMLFVPSVDGISHSLDEFTKDEDLVSGLRHLTEVVRRLAAGALACVRAGRGTGGDRLPWRSARVRADRSVDVVDVLVLVDELLGQRLPLRICVGEGRGLHVLCGIARGHALPVVDLGQARIGASGVDSVEGLRCVHGIGDFVDRSPIHRGSLLERTGGIAVSAVEILQARFLQCGHHGDRLRVLRQVCALADADDGAGVVDLFGAELIRVVD